ncbi:MAG: hypothetical protein MUD01_16830 [Chloroflexaceae bacterium]|jgi:hypothetical protein|nr:hypothetical protein [Chloroflexaceae bacterium]
MNETMTLEVSTCVYGLGRSATTPPLLLSLPALSSGAGHAASLPARDLIAAHVRAEVERAHTTRVGSIALHYLLADDPRLKPTAAQPEATPTLRMEDEIARAWQGLAERRYMLLVDGMAVTDLDTPLTLTGRSRVNFVRLLPLIGG